MTLEPRRHQALNGSGEPAPGEGQAANGVAHSDNSGAAGDLPTLIEKIAAHIASSEDLVAQQVSPAQDIREGAALSPWDCQSADDLARVLGRLEETHEAPCAAPAPAGPEAVAPPSGVLTAPAIPGHDFDCFEHRLGVALHDVARRADVAGLRLVEAHVTEVLGGLTAARP